MQITFTDESVTYIADPVTRVKAGVVVHKLNMKPEYNGPSSDEGYNDFDPEFADGYERALIREKEFEND